MSTNSTHGLLPDEQMWLAYMLCQVEIRQDIQRELKHESPTAPMFLGRIAGYAIDLIRQGAASGKISSESLDSLPTQRQLAGRFELRATDVSKLVNGSQSGGMKKGSGKQIDWMGKAREILSFVTAGCDFKELDPQSPAKHIDHYFFRDKGTPSIWQKERRGSVNCFSYTELGAEVARAAFAAQLGLGSPPEVFFLSGGPAFFSSELNDSLAAAIKLCLDAGVKTTLAYTAYDGQPHQAKLSFDSFCAGHELAIKPRVIAEEQLTKGCFHSPVSRWISLSIDGSRSAWLIRPPVAEPAPVVTEPIALRGRVEETEAFYQWIRSLDPPGGLATNPGTPQEPPQGTLQQ